MYRWILGIFVLWAAGFVYIFSSLANEDSGDGPRAPVIVVGFVGGFVKPDDVVHSPVQVAGRVRAAYPTGVYVKVFQNHRREDAHQEILKQLDVKHDGKPSEEDRKSARIIIYGMSWGGSETVALARELQAERIPVLLTIQVDSVSKFQGDDGLIPSNVAEAANFYQSEGMLHGKTQIRAADPAKTKILGNFRYQYLSEPAECAQYPWWDRWFVKPHTEIECDPVVWRQVETLIVGRVAAVLERGNSREREVAVCLGPAGTEQKQIPRFPDFARDDKASSSGIWRERMRPVAGPPRRSRLEQG